MIKNQQTWQAAGVVLRTLIIKWETELEVDQGFKLSKPIPSDLLPAARLYLLNLPKQCHQLKNQEWAEDETWCLSS